MTRQEIINNELLTLPKDWSVLGYSSYYEAVESISNEYLSLLENIDDSEFEGVYGRMGRMTRDELLILARNVQSAVLKPLQVYLEEGNPHKAYQVFDEHFSIASDYPKNTAPVTALDYSPLHPESYRVRRSDTELTRIDQMFHVPFEIRHMAESARFSIPGYPTLYLANSLFLAHLELGLHDVKDLYISKVMHKDWFGSQETVLDLQTKPRYSDDPLTGNRFLGRWPLVLACCLKVAHPASPFKPEYILPQIVLQWVRNKILIGETKRKVIGVMYSTSKVCTLIPPYEGHFFNLAIPVVKAGISGFCSTLKSKFEITKPLSFAKLLTIPVEPTQEGQVKSISIGGQAMDYVNTDYGRIETILNTRPYSDLFSV